MGFFLLQQFVRSIFAIFCFLLWRAEQAQRDAALILCFQRAADVAEGACLAQEHIPEGACEHAVQVARVGGEHFGQGGQMQVVFDPLQRGTPFRIGYYIVLLLIQ